MVPNSTPTPIDTAVAWRKISADLIAASLTPYRQWGNHPEADRIAQIDAVTDRAAALGLCRPRTDFDPAMVSHAARIQYRT